MTGARLIAALENQAEELKEIRQRWAKLGKMPLVSCVVLHDTEVLIRKAMNELMEVKK